MLQPLPRTRSELSIASPPSVNTNTVFNGPRAQKGGKKFDAPVPLSEFAKRGKTAGVAPAPAPAPGQSQSAVHHMHTGHGRRDQLTAGERTRILRMLRDEGGRLADEDSGVYIGAAPGRAYDLDIDDDSPAPAPAPTPAPMMLRPDVPARPALVVGLEQAKLNKKPSGAPAVPALRRDAPSRPMAAAVMPPPQPPPRAAAAPPPTPPLPGRGQPSRRPVPPPFNDEPTRQVDDDLLAALRSQQQATRPPPSPPSSFSAPPTPAPRMAAAPSFNDEPTRLANVDPQLRTYDDNGIENNFDEATSIASLEGIAAMERARHQGPTSNEERTRAVNIRNDPSISDIDWDLD